MIRKIAALWQTLLLLLNERRRYPMRPIPLTNHVTTTSLAATVMGTTVTTTLLIGVNSPLEVQLLILLPPHLVHLNPPQLYYYQAYHTPPPLYPLIAPHSISQIVPHRPLSYQLIPLRAKTSSTILPWPIDQSHAIAQFEQTAAIDPDPDVPNNPPSMQDPSVVPQNQLRLWPLPVVQPPAEGVEEAAHVVVLL